MNNNNFNNESIYYSFCFELNKAQNGEINLLNEEDSLFLRFSDLCNQKLNLISNDLNLEEFELWSLERNTWKLIQSLYSERMLEQQEPSSPTPRGSTSKNPYTSPLTVVQQFISENKQLIELNAIRDWLHSIPSSLNPAEIRRGYLSYTKNKLKQARRTGGGAGGGGQSNSSTIGNISSSSTRGLVQELDPDAILRGKGTLQLDSDDSGYERALLRSLYEYVRAGDLDLAIDMCRQSDQSWRAASLSGGKLWEDPILANNEDGSGYGFNNDDDEMEMGDEIRLGLNVAKGNVNRKMWKMMCRKIAGAVGLDPYEKALYGAISGDTTSVLPVCTTWEDHVWVHLNSLFEEQIEVGLATSAEGRFWNRGSIKSVGPISNLLDPEDPLLGTPGRSTDIKIELEIMFDKIRKLEMGDLNSASRHPFRVSQTHLIVDKVDELFTTFVDRMEQAAEDTEEETLAHLLRFFAHLVLSLRLLKIQLPEYAANRILEAYVKVLEANNQDENLIAFYAATLSSDSAVESYARFLLTFGLSTDRLTRQTALLKAHEHGLDLAKIACRTVELVLLEVMNDDYVALDHTSPINIYARLDDREKELIRSLEWLTFDASTYVDALTQANALVRYFLSTNSPHAARSLLFEMPVDLLPSTVPDNDPVLATQVREYLDYTSFFSSLEKHTRWSETWARKPLPTASKLDQTMFRDGITTLINEFYTSTLDILESDWLISDLTISDRRSTEMAAIRQLIIPHLIMRLHFALYESGSIIPSNLQRCLDLANVVADERYKLYLEFITERGNKIGDYLNQVRPVMIEIL